MSRIFIRNFSLVIVAAFALCSCGDENKNPFRGEVPSITLEMLSGTYKLRSFAIVFENGTTTLISGTQQVRSFSGKLVIKESGQVSETVTINGVTWNATGTFTIIDDNTLGVKSGGCSYELGMTFLEDRNELIISISKGTCGINRSGSETWKRTSKSTSKTAEYLPL